jgi:hypothetical protein
VPVAYSRGFVKHTTPVSFVASVIASALLAGACSFGATEPTAPSRPDGSSEPATTSSASTAPTTTTTIAATTTTTEPPRDCRPLPGDPPSRLTGDDPAAEAIDISRATFPCADHVTVVPAGDPAVAAAAAHAITSGGPLLLLDGTPRRDLSEELDRLGPELITVAGAAGFDAGLLDAYRTQRLPGHTSPGPDGSADRPERLWIVGDGAGDTLHTVHVAASATGDLLLPVGRDDLLALPGDDLELIRDSGDVPTVLVGGITEDADWQLAVIRSGQELPGGGLVIFPGRRVVALYGNPLGPVLGVLGEQGPEEAAARAREVAEPYGADGLEVLPAFEIITTVADSRAGADGDYSNEMDADVIRPWVDAAAAEGLYVLLDLQPGRTDFLTQAKRYEEFLAQPHVGLALDPEWRLGPDQVHLEQFGTVDAAEINEVADWLAGLVRDGALPQKMLLIHQFRFSMVTNRDLVAIPSELAVLVQMDGQGPLSDKYETWQALTTAPDAGRFWWGWKNFYDEDLPTATPNEVLALTPTVYYVSYQ